MNNGIIVIGLDVSLVPKSELKTVYPANIKDRNIAPIIMRPTVKKR